MVSYLILCRSLTDAQSTAHVLERSGISGHVMRAPKAIAGEGCGFCVKIPEHRLAAALPLLRQNKLEPRQIYMQLDDGGYSEVGHDLSG